MFANCGLSSTSLNPRTKAIRKYESVQLFASKEEAEKYCKENTDESMDENPFLLEGEELEKAMNIRKQGLKH